MKTKGIFFIIIGLLGLKNPYLALVVPFKLLLWRLWLTKDVCPYCGKKLKEHGFRGFYICPDKECEFNR
jgi:hypothetical protein